MVVTTQMSGVVLGPLRTWTARSDGTLSIAEDRKPTVTGAVAAADVTRLSQLIADPALPGLKSSGLHGEGTLITIRVTGDVSLDLHFQAPAPAPAAALVQAVIGLAPAPH